MKRNDGAQKTVVRLKAVWGSRASRRRGPAAKTGRRVK
jgi:hypothetical protein